MKRSLSSWAAPLDNPARPFVAILGGAKVSDKIGVITNLLDKCDALIIGGGMAYTFVKAMGGSIGNSLLEEDKLELCPRDAWKRPRPRASSSCCPSTPCAADSFSNDANTHGGARQRDSRRLGGHGHRPQDPGALLPRPCKNAKTVVWNGPMGVFEFPNFAKGTSAVAQAMADI